MFGKWPTRTVTASAKAGLEATTLIKEVAKVTAIKEARSRKSPANKWTDILPTPTGRRLASNGLVARAVFNSLLVGRNVQASLRVFLPRTREVPFRAHQRACNCRVPPRWHPVPAALT